VSRLMYWMSQRQVEVLGGLMAGPISLLTRVIRSGWERYLISSMTISRVR
jgi:hypothetical protein